MLTPYHSHRYHHFSEDEDEEEYNDDLIKELGLQEFENLNEM
jgi:hypothetical protein